MKKYFAIFKYGLKMNFAHMVDYLVSLISFTIHVSIFNALWDFILKDGTAARIYEKRINLVHNNGRIYNIFNK